MDGIENIAYVLIGIGWFAWNTYRKYQAGKEPGQPKTRRSVPADTQPESEHSRSLEDMILEQFGDKQVPEPVAAQYQRHENQDKFLNTDLTHSHLSDDYEMSKSEMKSHRVERQVRKLEEEETEEESILNQIMPDGFDLRQAIIMNAVLERPYL